MLTSKEYKELGRLIRELGRIEKKIATAHAAQDTETKASLHEQLIDTGEAVMALLDLARSS